MRLRVQSSKDGSRKTRVYVDGKFLHGVQAVSLEYNIENRDPLVTLKVRAPVEGDVEALLRQADEAARFPMEHS